jgi:DNA-3-methyladenine glycosylase
MTQPDQTYHWLAQDALIVAPRLLGWELISRVGETETGGRIVEVEAYHGTQDPASHAYRGLTPRTAPMFAEGGGVYVYLSYGIHTCMNITTGPAGEASAVLVRALEPTQGLETMTRRRHTTDPRLLTRGPGRLAQALGIGLTHSGVRLGSDIVLRPPQTVIAPRQIVAGPRIGIKQAKDHLWRFYISGNPFVSGPRTLPLPPDM